MPEVIARPGAAHVEIFDTMLLLGNIGEMKIDGKGPHQMNGVVTVQASQEICKFGGNAGGAARLTKPLGKVAHFLNSIKKGLTVLTDKGISQLMSQTPNIGPQRRIGGLGPRGNGLLGMGGACHGRDSKGIFSRRQEKSAPCPQIGFE